MTQMQARLANPAPLGLMGFGMTTILLNLHNAGFFPMSWIILSMGIFFGGMAQIVAGIMEFKAYNTDPITLFSVKEFERFAFDQRNLRLFSSCIADIFKAGPASSIPKTGEFDLDPF